MWGHSSPRLAEDHPAEDADDESVAVITTTSGQMELIMMWKSSHSPADIIRVAQLDSKLVCLIGRCDRFCTSEWARWKPDAPSASTVCNFLCGWSQSEMWWGVWWWQQSASICMFEHLNTKHVWTDLYSFLYWLSSFDQVLKCSVLLYPHHLKT